MTESIFAILLALQDPTHPANELQPRVLLQLFLSIVLREDLPMYQTLVGAYGVDLAAVCRQIVSGDVASSSALRVTKTEFDVVVRIISSAACGTAAAAMTPERVLDLMLVSTTLFAAGVASELAASVKQSVAAAAEANRNAMTSSAINAHGGMSSFVGVETPAFVVDRRWIARLADAIDSPNFGSAPAEEQILTALPGLSREAQNLWRYALASRREFGGMDLQQRGELIGAALEMSGEELFPTMRSIHAAAAACLARVMKACVF